MSSSRRSRLVRNRHARTRRTLQIQKLEDRSLMAVYTWTGGAADGNWTSPTNWSVVGADSGGISNLPDSSGDSVVFGGQGAGNVNVPVGIVTDSIAFTGTAANYTLTGGDIQLTSGGSITQNVAGANALETKLSGTGIVGDLSAGTLRLGNVNNALDVTSSMTVGAGARLEVMGAATQALNNAELKLDGGTAVLVGGTTTTANALDSRLYHNQTGTGINSPLFSTLGRTANVTRNLAQPLNFVRDADGTFTTFFNGGTPANSGQPGGTNFTAAFYGDFNVAAGQTGAYTFAITDNDDRAVMWLDLNQNGIFETTGSAGNELVRDVGCCGNTGTFNVNLPNTGKYRVAFVVEDTGGNSGLVARFAQGASIPLASLAVVDPAAAAQAGRWSFDTASAANFSTLRVSASGNSALEARVPNASIASLATAAGSQLRFVGGGLGQSTVITVAGATTLAVGTTTIVSDTPVTLAGSVGEAGASANLTKSGSHALTLNNANTYSGVTTISAGTVVLGNNAALGTEAGKTVILSGATLDIRGFRTGVTGNEPIEVIGTGFGGAGAIVNNGADQTSAARNITLTGDATFGGSGRWDIRNTDGTASLNMGGFTLTKVGGREFSLINASIVNPGNVIASGGTFRLEGSTLLTAPGRTVTVNSGATLDFWANNQSHDFAVNLNGGTLQSQGGGTPTLVGTVTLSANSTISPTTNSGTSNMIISGKITGSGTLTKNGAATLSPTSTDNDYTGATVINDGVLVVNSAATLGTTAGATTVFGPGALRLDGSFTLAEALTLGAKSSQAVLDARNGAQTLTGDITIPSSMTISSATGNSLTISSPTLSVSPYADLTFAGDGNTTITSAFGSTGTLANAFMASYYEGTAEADLNNVGNGTATGGMLGRTPTVREVRTGAIDFRDNFGTGWIALNDGVRPDNFSALWVATFTAPETGNYVFKTNDTDDRSRIWVDRDQDGLFEDTVALGATAGDELLAVNNGATTIALTAGQQYKVGLGFHEFGGSEAVEHRITTPSLTERIINPSDATQANWWTAPAASGRVIKQGSGTLRLEGANNFAGETLVQAGTLIAANATALGNVAAGTVVSNGATLALDGGVSIGAESLTMGSIALAINAPTLRSISGDNTFAGNIALLGGSTTVNAAAGSLKLTGSIQLGQSNLVVTGAGNVAIEGAVTGNNAATSIKIAGLAEGRIAGTSINTTTANPATAVQLGIRMGQTSSKGPWGDNETWVYTGEFFDADGTFAFAENIDDVVYLKIDGVVYINNGTWNVATSTVTKDGYQTRSAAVGTIVPNANASGGVTSFGMGQTGDGWHSFELRLFNGGGGAGATGQDSGTGWSTTYGIGYNAGPALPADANGSGYVMPVDSGAGTLFRNTAPINTSHILKQGTGSLTLSNAANTYTGGTIISQGTVLVAHPDALGSGAVTLNDANTAANNTALLATFGNGANGIDNNIVVANQGSGTSTIGSTSFNPGALATLYNGTLTLNKSTTLTAGNTDRTTYTNVISGNVGTLTVTGGARTTFQASNTFVGNVAITGAGTTLQVGTAGDQIPDASNLDVGAGTTFTLNADGEAINALTGSGNIQNIIGGNTLTIGSAGGGGTYSGTFNNGSGPLSVTKVGAGTQILNGTGATNSGATGLLRVQQGQIDIGGGFTGDGAWKGDVTIDSNATLRLLQGNIFGNGGDFTVHGTLDMNGQSDVIGNLQGSGNVINNSNASGIMLDDLSGTRTFTGNISGGGGFQLRGSVDSNGTQVLSGGNYAFGDINLGRGTLTLTNNATVNAAGIINVGHNNIVGLTSGSLTATLNVNSGTLTARSMDFGNTNSQGGMTANGILNQTAGIVTTTGQSADNNGIRLGHWPTGVGTYNLSGGILNVGGTFALSTATDGTGRFIQTGGQANVQQLDLNSRANTTGNGTFTLNGGTFNVGSGGIVRDDNNAPATINLGGGTLRATAQWASPVTIPINLTNAVGPAVIDTNGFNITIDSALTGAGGLDKIGAGRLILNGASNYSGPTNVQVGTLAGDGSVTSAVNISGFASLSPGGSPGDFATGALNVASGGSIGFEINASGNDQVVATSVNLNNASWIFTSNVTPPPGTIYTLISNTGVTPTTGAFSGLPEGSVFDLLGRYYITYNDPLGRFGTGNDVALIRNRLVTPAADNFTLSEDGSFTGSLKTNDTDLDLDGTITLIGGVTNGTLSLNSSTGAFTYTPNANWSGTETFQYWLNDGEFGSAANAVTVTINVTAVADEPSLTVGNVTGDEGMPISLGIASTLADTDGSESLVIVVSGVPAGATLSAGVASSGGTVYTLTRDDLAGLTLTRDNNLPANAPFTLNVVATATETSNGAQATSSGTFSVTVKNAAPQPVQNQVLVDGVPQTGTPASINSTVGLPITFVVSTTDPAFANLDAPFTFSLNWGDGTIQSGPAGVIEGQQISFTHDYLGKPFNLYTPKLTVTDVEGLSKTIDLTKINLSNIVVIDGTLFVGGSANADRITIYPANGGADVLVRFNNVQTGPYTGVTEKVVVYGNANNDTINVSGSLAFPVEFYGGAGNDYLTGGGLDDILDGGDGTDRLLAGLGNDLLYGGAGNDTLSGGGGDDLLDGDSYLDLVGNVILPAASLHGKDVLNGEAGDDTIYGHGNNDTINGGVGNDFLRGGAGTDTMSGDAGDDLLAGDADGDKLYGRDGLDVLVGGAGADTIYGSTGEDLMYGSDLTTATDALLRSLALDWAGGDQDQAVNDVIGNKKNDNAADSLYGEGSNDWYLMFVLDKISTPSDSTTNRVTTL